LVLLEVLTDGSFHLNSSDFSKQKSGFKFYCILSPHSVLKQCLALDLKSAIVASYGLMLEFNSKVKRTSLMPA